MKFRLICAFGLVAQVLWAASAIAQNSVDIEFEGPWIFYHVSSFQNSLGQNVPVLVAMAPTVNHHHDPTFSTGEGFPFPAGVWCVGFDNVCGTKTQALMGNGGFPVLQALPVASKSGWHWYNNSYPNPAWYVILPMPEANTNDGLNDIKVGNTFGVYVNGPVQRSIGARFHYQGGAQMLNLFKCGTPTSDNCPNPQLKGSQSNSGTLRITIKYDEDLSDHCDLHVRDAYHQAILFLDQTPLNQITSQNVNQDKAYIDLPQDDGSYDASCYACDPQNPAPACLLAKMTKPARPVDVNATLHEIVTDLRTLRREDDRLLQSELSQEENSLNGRLPTFSQLPGIEQLLARSTNAVHNLYVELSIKDQAAKDSVQAVQVNPLLPNLKKIETEEQVLHEYIGLALSGTSGKDCRAAQMQVN